MVSGWLEVEGCDDILHSLIDCLGLSDHSSYPLHNSMSGIAALKMYWLLCALGIYLHYPKQKL
jgi:hypothetical protein